MKKKNGHHVWAAILLSNGETIAYGRDLKKVYVDAKRWCAAMHVDIYDKPCPVQVFKKHKTLTGIERDMLSTFYGRVPEKLEKKEVSF